MALGPDKADWMARQLVPAAVAACSRWCGPSYPRSRRLRDGTEDRSGWFGCRRAPSKHSYVMSRSASLNLKGTSDY